MGWLLPQVRAFKRIVAGDRNVEETRISLYLASLEVGESPGEIAMWGDLRTVQVRAYVCFGLEHSWLDNQESDP